MDALIERLNLALTAYEAAGYSDDPDYDRGYALYEEILEIMEEMSK